MSKFKVTCRLLSNVGIVCILFANVLTLGGEPTGELPSDGVKDVVILALLLEVFKLCKFGVFGLKPQSDSCVFPKSGAFTGDCGRDCPLPLSWSSSFT